MPLFDFWRKRPNKQVEKRKHSQRNPIPPPMRLTSNQSLPSKESEESGRQLILAWMRTGFFDAPNKDEWTIFRRQRRFLEAHPELLTPHIDTILQEMMAQEAGNANRVDLFRLCQRLLLQARAHGGTVESIRVAYTNIYGGLTLDVPEWLEQAMQRHAIQKVSERIVSLRRSITHAESDPTIPPEATAELYALLGKALWTDESTNWKDQLEEAVVSYKKVLSVYRYDRYPEHYAELQANLGNIYVNLSEEEEQQDNLERAERCFKEALRVFTPNEFPSQWANAQNSLGNTFLMQGGRKREQAIEHFEGALQLVGSDYHTEQWALIQFSLGVCYLNRVIEDRAKNLERALQCFNAAQRHYNREEHPKQWAELQINLGLTYLQRLEGDPATNIERSMYCFQATQRIPTEALTHKIALFFLEGMGNAYLKRIQGDPAENKELAIEYLTSALEGLENTPFYAKRFKIHNDLGHAFRDRIKGDRDENVDFARTLHRVVLMRSKSQHPAECQQAQLSLAYLAALPYFEAAQCH